MNSAKVLYVQAHETLVSLAGGPYTYEARPVSETKGIEIPSHKQHSSNSTAIINKPIYDFQNPSYASNTHT